MRLPCGSCDVRNLIVGKENRSIRTAAARQPCGRRVLSQDCHRAAAKKSQNILATRKVCKAVVRRPYVVCAFIVRSSYEFDPRGGYKCKDRGKHQAYIHNISTEAGLFVMAIIPCNVLQYSEECYVMMKSAMTLFWLFSYVSVSAKEDSRGDGGSRPGSSDEPKNESYFSPTYLDCFY